MCKTVKRLILLAALVAALATPGIRLVKTASGTTVARAATVAACVPGSGNCGGG